MKSDKLDARTTVIAYVMLSRKYEGVAGLSGVVTGEKYRLNAHDSIHSSDDFSRLHVVESRLLLLGLKDEAKMIMDFRQIAGEFEKLALPNPLISYSDQFFALFRQEVRKRRVSGRGFVVGAGR